MFESLKLSEKKLAEEIVDTIADVCRHREVVLHEPIFNGNEKKYLDECITSTMVSYLGEYVDSFEKTLAEICGSKFAVAVCNGTLALELGLHLVGVKPNDEVITPAFSFVATANSINSLSAIPHFIDIEPKTLGLCPTALLTRLETMCEKRSFGLVNRETGRRIAAVIPMHCFGIPCRIEEIVEICKSFSIPVVEDAAEGLGSFCGETHVGCFGDVGALSFNGNKIVTTGGGGAIITNDEETALLARRLSTTAKVPHKWEIKHDLPAFNLRMPNLNAAVGCAQLEQLDGFISKKRQLHSKYKNNLSTFPNIRLLDEPIGCRSNYWLNTMILSKDILGLRDFILERTNLRGISTRPAWNLLNEIPHYVSCPTDSLFFSREYVKRAINLPSSANVL